MPLPVHPSHSTSNQSPTSVHANFNYFQTIFSFLITALFNFLQIHYQSKSKSPFDTHPALFLASLAALLLYSSLAAAYLISPIPWHRPTLMALTAYLFVASLLSLLCHGLFYFLLCPLPIFALLSSVPFRGFICRLFPQVLVVFSSRRAAQPPPPPPLPLTLADTRNQMVSRTFNRIHRLIAARDPLQLPERGGLALVVEAFGATSPPSLQPLSPVSSSGFIRRICQLVFPLVLVMFSGGRAPLPPTLPLTDANAHSSGVSADPREQDDLASLEGFILV